MLNVISSLLSGNTSSLRFDLDSWQNSSANFWASWFIVSVSSNRRLYSLHFYCRYPFFLQVRIQNSFVQLVWLVALWQVFSSGILLTMRSALWFGTSSSTKYIALSTFTWFLGDSFMMSLHSRCKLLITGMSKYTASRTLTRTCKVVLENQNKHDRNQSVVRCFWVMIYTLDTSPTDTSDQHWSYQEVAHHVEKVCRQRQY